jgi:hypothetical protein
MKKKLFVVATNSHVPIPVRKKNPPPGGYVRLYAKMLDKTMMTISFHHFGNMGGTVVDPTSSSSELVLVLLYSLLPAVGTLSLSSKG